MPASHREDEKHKLPIAAIGCNFHKAAHLGRREDTDTAHSLSIKRLTKPLPANFHLEELLHLCFSDSVRKEQFLLFFSPYFNTELLFF